MSLAGRSSDAGAPILIVGAGQAGATAASALRKLGYDGALILVGDEDHAPYERPPLSKTALLEADKDAQIAIHQAGHYEDSRIDLRLGVRVARIDPPNHRVLLGDGSVLPYAQCLLATGGRARELPGHPAGSTPGLHYVRTLADARALRAQLHALRASPQATDTPLVILGAGFLGLEVASTALSLGIQPLVIEPGPRLLARAAPQGFSEWLQRVAHAQGVQLRLGVGCNELRALADGLELRLTDGTVVRTPCAVAAVGQLPNTRLAQEAGLAVCAQTGGIVIDAQGRTSAVDVFAAGDCTTQLQPLLGQAIRLESWQSANEQARVAAAAMLGQETEPAATPWFWTDMFGLNIQMMGLPRADLEFVWRASPPEPVATANPTVGGAKFLMFGLDEALRMRYALAVNAGGDLRTLRPVFTQELACPPDILSDTSRSLRDGIRQIQAAARAPSP